MLTLAPLPRKTKHQRIKGWTLTVAGGPHLGALLAVIWSRGDLCRLERAMTHIHFRMSWPLPRLRRELRRQLYLAGVCGIDGTLAELLALTPVSNTGQAFFLITERD